MDNWTIAEKLIDRAHELEAQRVNLYRVRAYRRAAETVLGLEQPVADILDESGRGGLRRLRGIGSSLSEKIESLVRTGAFDTLTEELAGAT